MTDDTTNPFAGSIELTWPGKDCVLKYQDGKWQLIPYDDTVTRKALVFDSHIGEGGNVLGYCVKGNILSSMAALHSFVPSAVSFIYFDAPRLKAFQEEAVGGYAISTWLSLIQNTAKLSLPCLKRKGFFALHTDEQMSHYARMVLEEVFGANNYVGTFAWQKQYAPQNDHNVPTDVLDYITVFSKCPADELDKIGLLVTPKDLKDDGDFRGCYTAGHKGARSGSEATKFKVNTSPYHWEIVDSNLPEGRYYFDKILGVLWFESVNTTGDFYVKVRALDKSGKTAERTINFTVREPESLDDTYQIPQRIWWLLKNDNDIKKGGNLVVDGLQDEVLAGIRGQEFSLVFKASGGEPFTMRSDSPGVGRYWEFGLKTLIEGIARAKASFGSNGSALPSIKKYYDRSQAKKVQAVVNFLPWYDFGDTQDATQHCKALKAANLTSGKINMTAKPQKLLSHLISLFAPEKSDISIAIGDTNAVFASVAIKMRKGFIHVTGDGKDDADTWKQTASKRILATIKNEDTPKVEGNDTFPHEECKEGHVDVLKISRSSLTYNTKNGDLEPVFDDFEDPADFYAGLSGAYRDNPDDKVFQTINDRLVIVVPEDEELDAYLLDSYSRKYPGRRLVVIYESIDDNLSTPKNVVLKRAPFELI